MDTRNLLTIIGAFLTGFGALVIKAEVPSWAWWVGQGMVVLGPLLMSARAVMAGQQQIQEKKENNEK